MIRWLIDTTREIFYPNVFGGRSNQWSKVRDEHIRRQPECQVCGGTKDLIVHHKQPFHLFPELELQDDNLITLCETEKNGVNCHLLFGHLGNFRSFNAKVDEDVRNWQVKLATRP